MRDHWWDDAACKGTDPELWWPTVSRPNSGREATAKALCARCLCRAECLDDALDFEMLDPAIRGGLTTQERNKLRRRAGRPTPPHGTRARYVSSLDPCHCEACRRANSAYIADHRSRP